MDIKKVDGAGGGGKGGGHTPIEAPNSLQSVAFVSIVDLISEGEIKGLVNGDGRDVYFENTPIYDNITDTWNLIDTTVVGRSGTEDQDYIKNLSTASSPVDVGVEVTKLSGGIVRTISDADVEAVKILITVPYLMEVKTNGDKVETSFEFQISIQSSGEAYDTPRVHTISGKNTAPYQRQILIRELPGTGPWNIKIERNTNDSESATLINKFYWTNYVEIIYKKFTYPYSAYAGVTSRYDQFNRVPIRKYHIDGIKVQIPSNYNAVTREYSGIWNGEFAAARAWTNNPVWILYDLLTSNRYGYGMNATDIDTGSFYSASQYCDVMVDDGQSGTVPRYTFNWQGQGFTDSFHLANLIAGSFKAKFYWTKSKLYITQDRPTDPIINVSNTNVIDGNFTYTSTSLRDRTTQAAVQWNDPDDMYNLAIEYVDDREGIVKYGLRRMDTVALGCSEKSQAIRHGRWIIDNEKYSTEIVTYQAGLDHAGIMPGDVVAIFDQHYTSSRNSGRVKSATINTVTLDSTILIEGGKTYELRIMLPNGTLETKDVTNTAGSHSLIYLDGNLTAIPNKESVWQLISSSLSPRQFRVISKSETSKFQYEIQGVFHDPAKYARIESGIYIDPPIYTNLPDSNKLTAPTSLQAEEYQSNVGVSRIFNVLLSWTHSTDPRKITYEIQHKWDNLAYRKSGESADNSFVIENVGAGNYFFRVRTVGLTGQSNWLTLDNFNVVADTTAAADITGLQIVGGGTEWTGRNCEFEWDEITYDIDANFKDYKIQIMKTNDTHLRYIYTTYPNAIYTYEMNQEDNAGTPIRDIKVRVWCRDIYDSISFTPAVEQFSNPAPDMSSTLPVVTPKFSYLKVTWAINSDLDMDYYVVYCDTNNPPTTEVGKVFHPENIFEVFGLEYGTDYRVKIVPYDLFGEGIASQQPDAASPLQIPDINVDLELKDSVTITSDLTYSGDLDDVYDKVFSSGGITFTPAAGEYIQYAYNIENYFDRLGIWVSNANPRIYVGLSTDGSTWSFLKAQADHSLLNGELVAATNQADAATNYWQLAAGKNIALFPNNMTAKYVRVYFQNTTASGVYECVPSRILISELAAIENLSAISADIGSIVAGSVQSSDYAATTGFLIDLDSSIIKFGGSNGQSLSWTNATGLVGTGSWTFSGGLTSSDIESWAHPSDYTKVDGGELFVGSTIRLSNGGQIIFGNDAIRISSTGTDNRFVISGNGGPTNNDYMELTNTGINFFYRTGTNTHSLYKSLTRIETGTAANNATVYITGIFRDGAPKIVLAPNTMRTYDNRYPLQSQTLVLNALNVAQTGTGTRQYKFTARANLELSAGQGGKAINIDSANSQTTQTNTGFTAVSSSWYSSFEANTRRVYMNARYRAYRWYYATEGWGEESSGISKLTGLQVRVTFSYWNGNEGWLSQAKDFTTSGTGFFDVSFDTGVRPADIVHAYMTITHIGWGGAIGTTVAGLNGSNQGQLATVGMVSYSSDLTSTTNLANGTLTWWAIGS